MSYMISDTLHILDDIRDPAWIDYIGITIPGTMTVNLQSEYQRPDIPHVNDVAGWQHWLKTHRPVQVRLWQPGPRSLALLSCLTLLDIETQAVILHPLNFCNNLLLNGLRYFVSRIICYSPLSAHWLSGQGIDASCIRLGSLNILHNQNTPSGTGIPEQTPHNILALPLPLTKQTLLKIIWAATLAWYARPAIKLTIAGPVESRIQKDITELTETWNCSSLIQFDNTSTWQALLARTDLVLDSRFAGWNMLRLQYALNARKPVITADTSCRNIAGCNPLLHLLNTDKPRLLAGTILKTIDSISNNNPVSV